MPCNAFILFVASCSALYNIIDAKPDHVLVRRDIDDGLPRPVLEVKATMKLSKTEIPIDNLTADCADNSGKQCLNAMVCLWYLGQNVTGRHGMRYTFKLDAEVTLKVWKRVFFLEFGKKVHEKTAMIHLDDRGVRKCMSFPQIHVEDRNRLVNSLSQLGTDIVFDFKYELISPPNCDNNTLCPVLNQTRDPSVSEKATVLVNCTNNTCHYNLQVKITLDRKEITLGKTRTLIATIELSNIHDVCYGSEVVINHDASLQYEKITIVTESFRIDRIPHENWTVSEKFRIQGPLNKDQKVIFELQYSTYNVLGNKRELDINVKAIGTFGKEQDNFDNNDTASIPVKRDVLMELTGSANPKLLNYSATPPNLNISNFSALNISDVGPNVKVTFELTNKGESDLQSIQLTITYPFKEHQPKEHDYIVYPISIQEKGSGICNKEGVLNPANLTLRDENSRQKRAAQALTPRTTSSHSFVCNVNELKADDRFIVVFEFHLWTATLAGFYSKDDLLVAIQANAVYDDPLSTDVTSTTIVFGSVDIRVSKFSVSKTKMKTDPPNSSGKSKSTPVWVITVAVLSGILLKQF